MTARKLQMPGVRDSGVGGEGGDGAGAVAGGEQGAVQQQLRQHRENDDGFAAAFAPTAAGGGRGEQGRFFNCSSSGQAGLASAGVQQPLPLASRYVGASVSSALGSSWIRRLLPSTGELRQDVARGPKGVWGGGGGGGGEAGSQPAVPFLLASPPNEHEEQGMMGNGRMEVDSCRETSVTVSGNGEYALKGKGRLEMESLQDLEESGVGGVMRKAKTLPPHLPPPPPHPRTYAVEGAASSRLQQQQKKNEGGNRRTVLLSSRGESLANGTGGAVVRGFGPIRVVMKAPPGPPSPTSEYRVPGGNGPKLKGMEEETPMEADVPVAAPPAAQADSHRLSNATLLSDRKPSGAQAMTSQTGTKFTPLSIPKPLDDPRSSRPFCAVQFAGAWGFPRPKKQEVEREAGRSFAVQPDAERETAATGVAGGSKLADPAVRFQSFGEVSGFKHRSEAGYESGVERINIGSRIFSNGFVSSYPPAHVGNPGRKEDGGQAAETVFHSRLAAAENGSARPNSGAAGFPTDVENRKMKAVVGCGFSSRRNPETGPSHSHHQHHQHHQQHQQQQLFPEIPPSAAHHPFQGDMCIGRVGHPLPFSPHSSFPGEDNNNSGEETRNSRGGRAAAADPAEPPLTTLFGAPRAYEDGLDARGAAQSAQRQPPPWTSLFAAFKGHEADSQTENSTSSTPTLPPDVHSRLQEGSVPASRPREGLHGNGVQGETSGGGGGGRGGIDAHLPATPEARSRFNNQVQSSHFSSSPWPDEMGCIPNDEGGSGPYNSVYQSEASRVANRSSGESKGKYLNAYRYNTGGGREGFETPARSRDSSPSDPDSRKGAGIQGEDEGRQVSNEGNQQSHVSSAPLLPKEAPTSPNSGGHKDDTSDSSPPSYPAGYTSLEMGSTMLPRGIIDEHLLTIAGKLKNVEVDSKLDGTQVPRTAHGSRKDAVGFLPKRPKHSDAPVYGDRQDFGSAFPSKYPDWQQRSQPAAVRDVDREQGGKHGRPMDEEGLVPPGLSRHGKQRMSVEMGEDGGVSGPSKRTRHGSGDLGAQTAAVPSSWLKRWLPPSSGGTGPKAPPPVFARPKENPRISLTSKPPRSNGTSLFTGGFPTYSSPQARGGADEAGGGGGGRRGKGVDRGGHEMRGRTNGMKDILGKRGLNGLPLQPVPSAAAMVLAGAASRRTGHFPQQRKGPVSLWPSVYLHTAQAPSEGQRSSQSPELPM